MRKFKFEKLVRDKIVEGVINAGNRPKYKVLSDKEYIFELKKKLLEEAEELPTTGKDELIREIADIQEIIDNLLRVLRISKEDLKKEQLIKNKKAGSFKKRLYINYVETKEGSEWVNFYQKSPQKFPEIK